ncbi:MAG TPA: dihydrolipoamide acetyltransferase family protein [Candidatus Deferrimicrobiaceae bacterium]
MPTNIIMPSLGFDMTEGKVAAWLAVEGARVEKRAAVVEIETEKATVEVEAAASGILSRIVVPAGQSVPVGTVIGIIAEAGEILSDATPATEASVAPTVPSPRVKASPIARRMAEEAGIDLAQVQGSGDGGRVMERDVQAAIAARGTAPPATAVLTHEGALAGAALPSPGTPVPLSRMRQAIARRMTESKTTAPHFYATVEVRMDEVMKRQHRTDPAAAAVAPFSVNDVVIAATARTLAGFPGLNASWRDGAVVTHPSIGIGIAVALDDGLVTPVLHDAEQKPLKTITAEAHALAERAHAGKLRPEDVTGGTFTISNMSMLGVDQFIAIINPPEAAILAVGAVVRRPVADGDAIRIAPVMRVTISVDHRVADGAMAARFLQQLRKRLESPADLFAG